MSLPGARGQPGGDMWGSWASSQGPMPMQSPATFIPFAPPPPSADTGTDSWPSLSPGYHQQLLLGDAPLLVSLPCRIHAGEHTLLLGSPYFFPWAGTSGGCTSTRPGSLSQCARDGAPSQHKRQQLSHGREPAASRAQSTPKQVHSMS